MGGGLITGWIWDLHVDYEWVVDILQGEYETYMLTMNGWWNYYRVNMRLTCWLWMGGGFILGWIWDLHVDYEWVVDLLQGEYETYMLTMNGWWTYYRVNTRLTCWLWMGSGLITGWIRDLHVDYEWVVDLLQGEYETYMLTMNGWWTYFRMNTRLTCWLWMGGGLITGWIWDLHVDYEWVVDLF